MSDATTNGTGYSNASYWWSSGAWRYCPSNNDRRFDLIGLHLELAVDRHFFRLNGTCKSGIMLDMERGFPFYVLSIKTYFLPSFFEHGFVPLFAYAIG